MLTQPRRAMLPNPRITHFAYFYILLKVNFPVLTSLISVKLLLLPGIGLHRRDGVGDFTERHKDKVILTASLNGVKFEVEGHSTETVTIFNSNCIWECELSDIKRCATSNNKYM